MVSGAAWVSPSSTTPKEAIVQFRRRTSSAVVLLLAQLAECTGGGGGVSSVPPAATYAATPATTPSPTPLSSTASSPSPTTAMLPYTCPSSSSVEAVAGNQGSSAAANSVARHIYQKNRATLSSGLVAVIYRPSVISDAATIDARVAKLGAAKLFELDYPKTGVGTRFLHVAPSSASSIEGTLRGMPGIVAVAPSQRRSALAVTGPYLGDDPFFVGAPGANAPLYQSANDEGQWDMHIVQLDDAFAYSQQNNGSGLVNAGATGSNAVKLAIIDTGADVTQPDLTKASIVRTRCFITDAAGTAQSTGNYVVDELGHGTDVSGIAVGNPTNDYGFAGAGGNVSLMVYRVFPTPDDNCANALSSDPQCGADDADIASSIYDAIQNGANVISLSLGGAGCTNGQDSDPVEGAAIAEAISSGVIVVAASGNSGGQGVSAPACDPGVIAVGATGYNDGQPNGSGNSGAPGSEYVTSYTQFGPTTSVDNVTSWGIVAPGGDPTAAEAQGGAIDYLHWVENIWTSTPLDGNFAGTCTASPSFGEAGNCRTLIAGTSMATPHVSGAAALILSANKTYADPAKMFQLLCTTADNISDPHEGCGRLNVYRAMARALADPNLPTQSTSERASALLRTIDRASRAVHAKAVSYSF
jgi:subtilisin family serine protease